ncbi:MAG: right-handed parallel beta-helix repeat-containing protein [Planctomycetota bacterium]|nr:right-handed parallel beta-helix repeat-containing protein [Planctomycetota bacterium]
MNRTAVTCTCVATLGLLGSVAMLNAGPLTPPAGPVVSSYKTLTEVEPRTPISLATTPGDANSLFRITLPGSYYLTENVAGVIGKRGIEIAAEGVTIDLMGFALSGVPGSLDGIVIETSVVRGGATIMNGTVQGWDGDGVDVAFADVAGGRGGRIEGVYSRANAGAGFRVSDACIVVNCYAGQNGGSGFDPGNNAVFENCIAQANSGDGFALGFGCTYINCEARVNVLNGFVANTSALSNCSATFNEQNGFQLTSSIIDACQSSDSGGIGIVVSQSLVRGCSVMSNTGGGIRTSTSSLIQSNRVQSGAFGIQATGTDNRIEGNNCTGATRGIDIDVAGNVIVRNTCSGNTTNWDVVIGNVCLVVTAANTTAAITGNSGGTAPGSVDPNANFTY